MMRNISKMMKKLQMGFISHISSEREAKIGPYPVI